VQGVHISEIQLSVEVTLQEVKESEQRDTRRVCIIYFQEILWYEFDEIPENARSVWEIKIFEGREISGGERQLLSDQLQRKRSGRPISRPDTQKNVQREIRSRPLDLSMWKQ
jgi:hypothetical protein